MSNKKFSFTNRVKSFKHAFSGLKFFFLNEHNGRIHAVASFLAIGLSACLNLSNLEWISILAVISAVLVAEIFNSSVEKLSDFVSPDIHFKIKTVKDLAAAAVLITSFLALAVGAIVFLPKLFAFIR